MMRRSLLAAICGMFLAVLSASLPCSSLSAQSTGKAHHVVVAVTSGDEADWNLTLGNIRNLIAGVKPDAIEVEVVAYGGGINMVRGESSVAADIAKLQEQGVKFVACQNSMRMHKLELKDLLPGMSSVPSGVVEVVEKQEQGWSYIKGGR